MQDAGYSVRYTVRYSVYHTAHCTPYAACLRAESHFMNSMQCGMHSCSQDLVQPCLYSYGLHSCGLYNYDSHRYGVHSLGSWSSRAYIVMAYIVMACIVMAYKGHGPWSSRAYIVTAYIGMACIVMACIVIARGPAVPAPWRPRARSTSPSPWRAPRAGTAARIGIGHNYIGHAYRGNNSMGDLLVQRLLNTLYRP